MTTPVVPPVTGYASIEDFELRTGINVPPEYEPALQQKLNDNSDLVKLYLGECEPFVAAAWPDMLTGIVCTRTNRQIQQPSGLSSASVGSTSVTYASGTGEGGWLSQDDTDILDRLMVDSCPDFDGSVGGVGDVGVGWGGPPTSEPSDQLWVLTGPAKRPS